MCIWFDYNLKACFHSLSKCAKISQDYNDSSTKQLYNYNIH